MGVQRGELEALIRDLGQIPPAIDRALRRDMRKAAQPALLEVRRRADWSTRIPAATTLTAGTGGRPGVTIRTSAAKAPHARPYEGLSGDPFHHPVYGDRRNWVAQAARPFFYSGVAAAAGEVAGAVGDIVYGVALQYL